MRFRKALLISRARQGPLRLPRRASPHFTPPPRAPAAAPPRRRAEKTRLAIYIHLFKEGVLVCEKDVKKLKHHELDLPNLHVVKAMLSLKSRNFVREVFNWCVAPAEDPERGIKGGG